MPRNATSSTLKAGCAALLLALFLQGVAPAAGVAARLKDIASVKGVRDNQLIGYGLVVGLTGTGDGKQAAFTNQSLVNYLNNLGIAVNPDQVNVKNVASVMITAQLPPFAKIGQTIDVTLSSTGDASSLQGGTLVPTALKGLDGKVYAMAQGPVSIGGFEITGDTVNRQKNHLTVARIPEGATVEREVGVSFSGKEKVSISLHNPDFTTVDRAVRAINGFLEGNYAAARDGATLEVRVPDGYAGREVVMLADLEQLEIRPDVPARVILDERTGTVVMGENVKVGQIALSHGNLSLKISSLPVDARDQAGIDGGKLVNLPTGTSLGEVVRALNAMGVAPRDMIAIFQSIKAAGALNAELQII
ncbi:MAG: flagellar basal body P-ring protein FlgI [Thermodesulfobacteriota bacterium]